MGGNGENLKLRAREGMYVSERRVEVSGMHENEFVFFGLGKRGVMDLMKSLDRVDR